MLLIIMGNADDPVLRIKNWRSSVWEWVEDCRRRCRELRRVSSSSCPRPAIRQPAPLRSWLSGP